MLRHGHETVSITQQNFNLYCAFTGSEKNGNIVNVIARRQC